MNNADLLKEANSLLLSAKSHIYSLKSIDDLKFYETLKDEHINKANEIASKTTDKEVHSLVDKLNILYRFCDKDIIPRLKQGKLYYMQGGFDIGTRVR